MANAFDTPKPPFGDRVLAQGAIGAFDSGVGGLTVLRELHRQLPNESILYFGDTARVPYGDRSAAEIIHFVRDILDWMQGQGVKAVVMACNTSSALALETVRQEYPFPILGIILPGARAAVHEGKRIGVISTVATAKSHAYQRAIHEINPQVQVWEVGCPAFVPLIEQNQIYMPKAEAIARQYLQPLLDAQIDTLIYGCTHYPHLAPVIQKILPPSVRIVDPAVHVVAAAAQELDWLGLRSTTTRSSTRFCVSGSPDQFALLSAQWIGYMPNVEQVIFPITSNQPHPPWKWNPSMGLFEQG